MTALAGPLHAFASYEPPAENRKTGILRIRPTAAPNGPTAQAPNGSLLLRRAVWVHDGGDRHAEDRDAQLRERTATALDPGGSDHVAGLLRAAHARRGVAMARLAARGRTVRTLRVTPMWRLVIGVGEEIPHEVGLTVHGTYGVPILPGSALKGVARRYARAEDPQRYAEYGQASFGAEPGERADRGPGPDTAPDAATSATSATSGPSEGKPDDGRVVFVDALPLPPRGGRAGVTVDVITPHAKDYYTEAGAAPPAEYTQPVPVAFFSVTSAVAFVVHLVGRSGDPDLSELGLDSDAVLGWLPAALRDLGIGAKTNAGYGYCDVAIEPVLEPASTGDDQGADANPAAAAGRSTPTEDGPALREGTR
ncbi:conserved hypothetical protein [Frankia canadensis]|uniref:CRISPR type III-associated protein domain-containing protein n=1 Tax=Frankia canadensis TaxID=1836972 RepID=A0A2I2KVM5_9ACTN|nr:type III-B CRISPR module RAMP protein Cmr6 [Frankia canadensis]SNQ49706.1 conserved hypothetical protein [Frankia canadensis]SOU56996.1 conserved hypothetical protein [Frankia canadensis]